MHNLMHYFRSTWWLTWADFPGRRPLNLENIKIDICIKNVQNNVELAVLAVFIKMKGQNQTWTLKSTIQKSTFKYDQT